MRLSSTFLLLSDLKKKWVYKFFFTLNNVTAFLKFSCKMFQSFGAANEGALSSNLSLLTEAGCSNSNSLLLLTWQLCCRHFCISCLMFGSMGCPIQSFQVVCLRINQSNWKAKLSPSDHIRSPSECQISVLNWETNYSKDLFFTFYTSG